MLVLMKNNATTEDIRSVKEKIAGLGFKAHEIPGADLVVGYNILGFDYEVLRAYTDRDLLRLPTVDLMRDLEAKLGFRPKLDSVVQPTLGVSKSADGLQALEWWRRGELDKILAYCRDDVRVTRDLYDYGKRNRCVLVARFGGTPRRVEVDW